MRAVLVTGLGLALCVSAMTAQESSIRIPGPAASILFTAFRDMKAADTTAPIVPPTHWKEGLLIGALTGTAGLGVLGFGLCEGLSESSQDNCLVTALGGAAIGAVLGGTIGALIGGQFPKRSDSLPAPDSTTTSP